MAARKRKRPALRRNADPRLLNLRIEALEMRREGASYLAIAQKQGCSLTTAFQRVDRGIRIVLTETCEKVRKLESARLDALFRPNYKKAIELGDSAAVDTCLRIMARRARLFGLDEPAKTEAVVGVQATMAFEIPAAMPPTAVKLMVETALKFEFDEGKRVRLLGVLSAIEGLDS